MKGSTSMKIIPLYNNFNNISQIQQDFSSYEINNYIKRSQSPNQLQRNDLSSLLSSYDNTSNKQDIISYEINNYQNKSTNQSHTKTNFQSSKDSSSLITNYDNILNTSQQNQQNQQNQPQNQNSNISTYLSPQAASPEITTSVVYVNPLFSRIQKKTLKRNQLPPNVNHISPPHSQLNGKSRINLLKSQSTNNVNINNSLGTTKLKKINILNDLKNNISYTGINPITEITSTSADITTPQKNNEIYTKFQDKQLKNSKSTTNYLYPKNMNNPLLQSYDYSYNYTDVKHNNSNDNINSIVNNLFSNKNNNNNNNKSSSDIFFNVNNEKDSMTSAKKNVDYFSNYLNNSENTNSNNLKNIFNESDFSKYNYDNNYLNNSNNIYSIIDNNYKITNDIYANNSSNSNGNKNSYNNNGNVNKNLYNIYNYNNNQTNSKDIIYSYNNIIIVHIRI